MWVWRDSGWRSKAPGCRYRHTHLTNEKVALGYICAQGLGLLELISGENNSVKPWIQVWPGFPPVLVPGGPMWDRGSVSLELLGRSPKTAAGPGRLLPHSPPFTLATDLWMHHLATGPARPFPWNDFLLLLCLALSRSPTNRGSDTSATPLALLHLAARLGVDTSGLLEPPVSMVCLSGSTPSPTPGCEHVPQLKKRASSQPELLAAPPGRGIMGVGAH